MSELIKMRCEACQEGAPQVTPDQIKQFSPQIPEWQMIEVENVKRLQRTYRFRNFKDALAFANRVGDLAEENDHHPEITLGWGYTTVTWWTHKIKGLHINDFVMAAKSDTLV